MNLLPPGTEADVPMSSRRKTSTCAVSQLPRGLGSTACKTWSQRPPGAARPLPVSPSVLTRSLRGVGQLENIQGENQIPTQEQTKTNQIEQPTQKLTEFLQRSSKHIYNLIGHAGRGEIESVSDFYPLCKIMVCDISRIMSSQPRSFPLVWEP